MDATADAAVLLEPLHNRVTDDDRGRIGRYEVSRHRCRCWFCPECCRVMGMKLRRRLNPILATFEGLLLVTLTVDPSLFASPKDAYFYIRERRCIARTIQDLWRRGVLHSRRYFYVVEWQKRTEQAHFHILLDASFVPWSFLLASWSKHRPETAGPVVGGRPAFGTVLISVPRFGGGPEHAANYVTKYLTKIPEQGFPAWVLDLGAETRVRRYSASRGFWGEESEQGDGDTEREMHPVTYRKRIGGCGDSVDLFEVRQTVDHDTGEIIATRAWIGEIIADAGRVLAALDDGEPPGRHRRALRPGTFAAALAAISTASGRAVEWRRGGHPPRLAADVPERWTQEQEQDWRHSQYDVDAEIERFMESQR